MQVSPLSACVRVCVCVWVPQKSISNKSQTDIRHSLFQVQTRRLDKLSNANPLPLLFPSFAHFLLTIIQFTQLHTRSTHTFSIHQTKNLPIINIPETICDTTNTSSKKQAVAYSCIPGRSVGKALMIELIWELILIGIISILLHVM